MTILDASRDEPLLTFDATTTIEDQMAFNRYVRTLPDHKQKRTAVIVGAISAAPLFALFVCIVMRWTLQGGDCDIDGLLGAEGRGPFFLKVLGCVLLAEAGMAALYIMFWKRNIERSVRTKILQRLHVDSEDVSLRETLSFAFYSWGFSLSTACAAEIYDWRYVERVDEVDDHIFLTLIVNLGFIFPKRDLSPSVILALRDLMNPAVVKVRSRTGPSGPWS